MGGMVITMADGTKLEVKITPKDIIDFERKFDIPVSQLQVEQRYEWLLYLAWLSAKRSNGVTDTYDKWIGLVEDLDLSGSSDNPKAQAVS
jgi:hypothetical protein|tara:strand:+ start:265 stop:534 length:270 start_codon:yes stop_codon:yes gene_type:complete